MKPIIRFSNMSYAYPRTEEPAISNITFEVKAGEFAALTSLTGAGKSALCYRLNGVVSHLFSGHIKGPFDAAGCNTLNFD